MPCASHSAAGAFGSHVDAALRAILATIASATFQRASPSSHQGAGFDELRFLKDAPDDLSAPLAGPS